MHPQSVPPSSYHRQTRRAISFRFAVNSDLWRNLDWDASAAWTSPLANVPFYNVPGYTRVDSRLGWRAGESLEFSVVGQNLASPRHLEFADTLGINGTLVARSVFAKVRWRF